MRKIILTTLPAAGSFGLGMGAAHASAGPMPFTSPSASMYSDDGAAQSDARSALNTMLDRFLTVDVEAQASSTAAPGEAEAAKEECPEDSKTKVAEAEGRGAEDAKQKDTAGPEPDYFAI